MQTQKTSFPTSRLRAGFTLMETIIATALIVILAAIMFVNVVKYQRQLEQLELDATAKEIFIAAQNHLTSAHSLDLLKATKDDGTEGVQYDPGTSDTTDAFKDKDVFYFTNAQWGDVAGKTEENVLDLMLPVYSLDASVLNNSYVIQYQRESGRVLNVFYARKEGRFACDLTGVDYGDLLDLKGSDKKQERADYNGSVIGWYGAEAAESELSDKVEELKAPTLEIHNEEKLWLKVANANATKAGSESTSQLRILVTGRTSKAKMVLDLVKWNDSHGKNERATGDYLAGENNLDLGTFYVVLDDVTANGKHFSEVFADATQGTFIPGENLSIEVIALDNTRLSTIATSGTKNVNSLFASLGRSGANSVARVKNFRHLENLDARVSTVDLDQEKLLIASAEQLSNMDWDQFVSAVHKLDTESEGPKKNGLGADEKLQVRYKTASTYETLGNNLYLPVNCDSALAYDGKGHSIANVICNVADEAGLFGKLAISDPDGGNPKYSSVKNLTLVDFDVTSSGSAAGAVAGDNTTGATIENVLVRNSSGKVKDRDIVGATSAGGLVGTMKGGSVIKSAAAVYVRATGTDGAAGGLIGKLEGDGSIQSSYAGGHTTGGAYVTATADGADRVNAIAENGIAGGLVGSVSGTAAKNATITNSYATTSVRGATAGGFLGSAASTTVNKAYATGVVLGTGSNSGAFVGANGTGNGYTDAYYLLSVFDGIETKDTKAKALKDGSTKEEEAEVCPAAGSLTAVEGIAAGDADTNAYKKISGGFTAAKPYDVSGLNPARYPYQTIVELLGVTPSETDPSLVSTHYGDWPSKETLVVNTK